MRNWLIKNIVPLIAVSIIGTTLALYGISVIQSKPIDKDVLSDMRDLCIIIVGFYFGSSMGSRDKTELLNEKNKEDEKSKN